MIDGEYICARCLCHIHKGEEELVALVIYCPGCAKEYRDDAEIESLLKAQGCTE